MLSEACFFFKFIDLTRFHTIRTHLNDTIYYRNEGKEIIDMENQYTYYKPEPDDMNGMNEETPKPKKNRKVQNQ